MRRLYLTIAIDKAAMTVKWFIATATQGYIYDRDCCGKNR
ncbi:protein of unknown function [Vibrio tapetis subsp. tapetis]|uniref:Uncharacterized protein n=1 Tax=Vibrio tapetis subsp. tapetis TaxID=1671868 RepID=A0A2N8Z9X8_9VIBR|nr:protein of unknown function [Vibrio tapetis subsp. tapetis]